MVHRIDPQLKHELEELARGQNRSCSNFVNQILKQYVAQQQKKSRRDT